MLNTLQKLVRFAEKRLDQSHVSRFKAEKAILEMHQALKKFDDCDHDRLDAYTTAARALIELAAAGVFD